MRLLGLLLLAGCVQGPRPPQMPQEPGCCQRPCYCPDDIEAGQRARAAAREPQKPRLDLSLAWAALPATLQVALALANLFRRRPR